MIELTRLTSRLYHSHSWEKDHERHIPDTRYFKKLVHTCVVDLKRGKVAYCWTQEQLECISKIVKVSYRNNGVNITLTPVRRGR
jgi:hypothetical protein